MNVYRRIHKDFRYLKGTNAKAAMAAEQRLARYGKHAVLSLAWNALSKRPEVRYRIAWTLGLIGGRFFIGVLETLSKDRDKRVSYDAKMALARNRTPRGCRLAYRVSLRSPRDGIFVNAEAPASAPFILRMLSNPDSEVKRQAIFLAARNRRTRRLVVELANSKDKSIVALARDALSWD